MKTTRKLGIVALVLAVVFSGAFWVGQVIGPSEHAAAAPAAAAEEVVPAGLRISEEGFNLNLLTDTFVAGQQQELAFQILFWDGKTMNEFKLTHEKRMHLIVARHDLSNFQHVHPTMDPDGTWRIPLTFAEAGEYRIFADFYPMIGHHGFTLGANVSVSGDFAPKPLPAPTGSSKVDDYVVTLSGDPKPGESSKVTLNVTKDGKPVTNLEPYLGAYGHLIALRDGDLAFLHVHPDGDEPDGANGGPAISFFTEVPSSGNYRLFLDFKHEGVVRTAEFTVNVPGPNPLPHGLNQEQVDNAMESNKAANEKEEGGHGEHGGH